MSSVNLVVSMGVINPATGHKCLNRDQAGAMTCKTKKNT